jgi:hypothetical protein
MSDLTRMVRPWFRGDEGDHLYPDCPRLEGEPAEGLGWLDPRGTDVCESCQERHDPDWYAEATGDDY